MRKKIYIWGTGKGAEVVRRCIRDNVDITGYIDNDEKKIGKKKWGKTIFSFSEIDFSKTKVIVSTIEYKEIEQQIKKVCSIHNFLLFYDEKENLFKFWDIISPIKRKIELMKRNNMNKLISSIVRIRNKKGKETEYELRKAIKLVNRMYSEYGEQKIVIVGDNKYSKKFADKISKKCQKNLWGVITFDTEKKNDYYNQIRNIDEMFMEDFIQMEFFVIDPKNSRKCVGRLLDMGFDLSQINIVGGDLNCAGKLLDTYDVQLGYSRIDDIPGFTVFGELENDTFKIVTLGGSTSDPTLCNMKSWSEYLYNKLTKMGYKVTIYAGGVCSFTATQELYKLIRDVVSLKPDLVFSYSGINDAYENYYEKGHPFLLHYQKKVAQKMIGKRMLYNELQFNYPIKKITMGLEINTTTAEHWIKCERMMYSICREFGITFYAFLQPFNNSGYTKYEKFFSSIKKKMDEEWNTGWLMDFSDIFNGKQNIYIDICHVYEKGNQIIADNVLPYVLKEIKNNMYT